MTPPMRTAAQSPRGTLVGPKLCQQSRFKAVTSTRASTGCPDARPILPPMRRGKLAPTPASKQSRTAIGSQIGPIAALLAPLSISWRRMLVLSEAAPPPALSAGSASTTGAPACSMAARTPSATLKKSGVVLPRIETNSSPSRVASASALALSPSATTRMRPVTSATSA